MKKEYVRPQLNINLEIVDFGNEKSGMGMCKHTYTTKK